MACTSPFKNYPGPYPYPASTCVSINDELVHGIPGKRKLKEGDIVSVDCGTVYEGFVGDLAFTAGMGEISNAARHLLEVTEKHFTWGFRRWWSATTPGCRRCYPAICGKAGPMYVIREYTGHGVGRHMHEAPAMPNYGTPRKGVLLRAGMTIALEPMVLIGTYQTRVMPDEWTVASADGSLTAHFEHSVAITDAGPLILTVLGDGNSPGRFSGMSRYNSYFWLDCWNYC